MGRKRNGRAMSIPAGVGAGASISIAVTLIGAMVLAWMLGSERVGEQMVGYGCMVIQFMAAASGAATAWGCIRHNRLVVIGLAIGIYYLLLLLLALSFGNGFEGMGITALMVLLGGGTVQIPALFGAGSGAHRHKRMVFR